GRRWKALDAASINSRQSAADALQSYVHLTAATPGVRAAADNTARDAKCCRATEKHGSAAKGGRSMSTPLRHTNASVLNAEDIPRSWTTVRDRAHELCNWRRRAKHPATLSGWWGG